MFSTEHSLSRHIHYWAGYGLGIEVTRFSFNCVTSLKTAVQGWSVMLKKYTKEPVLYFPIWRITSCGFQRYVKITKTVIQVHYVLYMKSTPVVNVLLAKHVMSTANNVIANVLKSPWTSAINKTYILDFLIWNVHLHTLKLRKRGNKDFIAILASTTKINSSVRRH